MGLNDLIKRLSVKDKSKILGDNTTKIIRYSFVNNDNEALPISNIQVKGYMHALTARFTQTASYFLVYGNEKARKPTYDIVQFTDKIPQELSSLQLGPITAIQKEDIKKVAPLFENKAWLWIIMGIISLLLGYFSLKMLRK